MTYIPNAAEIEFDAACAATKAARAAFVRNRTAKNMAAFRAAEDRFDAAAEASRAEQDRVERAAVVAHRLAVTAGRRAYRARQGDLFAA
jgi:hypothetical protein